MILKDLNEMGTFNLNSSHFKLCLLSAEKIIEFLSVALVVNRRYSRARSFLSPMDAFVVLTHALPPLLLLLLLRLRLPSLRVLGPHRFVGVRMFWEAASFYAATIYIAIAMSSKDPIQLTQAIFNVERCLISLGLLERYNFIVSESFLYPLKRLLTLVTAKNTWVFDVPHAPQ
jgi:hypothetical protein